MMMVFVFSTIKTFGDSPEASTMTKKTWVLSQSTCNLDHSQFESCWEFACSTCFSQINHIDAYYLPVARFLRLNILAKYLISQKCPKLLDFQKCGWNNFSAALSEVGDCSFPLLRALRVHASDLILQRIDPATPLIRAVLTSFSIPRRQFHRCKVNQFNPIQRGQCKNQPQSKRGL